VRPALDHAAEAARRTSIGNAFGRRILNSQPFTLKGAVMSVAKVIELTATSNKSFEDAIQEGISRAGDSLSDVKGAWIKEQKVIIEKGKIVGFRVNMQVTFVLKGGKASKSR
jgi:flavin-binding protein dodecin